MSKVSNNSNYNKVSVKADSAVKMIQELSKLGVFKEKRKPRAKKAVPAADIRQEGAMPPGFTTPLGPQMRNLPPIQQIPQGATTQEIQDIQQRNAAALAQLRAEVQQGRITDIQNVGQALFSITNPRRERFRSQQEPGAGAYDPFERSTSGAIMLPDVPEETFTQTLNEGGPGAEAQMQETVFPVEETGNIATARLQPVERIAVGGGRKPKSLTLRKAVTDSYGLEVIPSLRNTTTPDMLSYYKRFMNATVNDADESIFTSKEKMFNAMNDIADEIAKTL
jgi:hypothetical protein